VFVLFVTSCQADRQVRSWATAADGAIEVSTNVGLIPRRISDDLEVQQCTSDGLHYRFPRFWH